LRGSTVLLDGSSSSDLDGDSLSYTWTLTSVPTGSAATLSNPSSPTPTFVADLVGIYVASLVVNDGTDTSIADEVSVVVDTVLIYQNDFSNNSLADFIVGQVGTALVSVDLGQLKITPGEGYLNRGYVALDLAAVSTEYPTVLSSSAAKVILAFNISNVDGTVCGACNNLFQFGLYSDPDSSAPGSFGYLVRGGGYVGSRVIFNQGATTIVDLADGPETLPIIGAFRIEYDPVTSQWDLYYEESTAVLDPMAITTLVGSGVNNGYTSVTLPYLIMASYNTDSAYFDNLSVMLKFPI